MKYFINLTAEDAMRLRRILHDLRQSLVVVESSMSWRNVGSLAPEYSLDDIVSPSLPRRGIFFALWGMG